MESIESKVLKTIKNTKRGVMFFPQDFQKIGSSEAIRLALHRLVKQNFILRVAQGIYVRPIVDELVGIVMPTTEEVAIKEIKVAKENIVVEDTKTVEEAKENIIKKTRRPKRKK